MNDNNSNDNSGDVMLGMTITVTAGVVIGAGAGIMMYASGGLFPLWLAQYPWWVWALVYGGGLGLVALFLYIIVAMID